MKTLQVSVVVLATMTQVLCWENVYDQELHFQCPQHASISRIVSEHNNHFEDRVFAFECKQYTSDPESCFWTDYVNDYDKSVIFECPHGGFIDGMSSTHSNHNEDRRWKFYCCQRAGMCAYNCYYSDWVNRFDERFDYHVPEDYILRGVVSEHDNHTEDRRFKFQVCKKTQCEEKKKMNDNKHV